MISAGPSGASYDIYATGDLNGNGVQSVRTVHADQNSRGVWVITTDSITGDNW